MRSSVFQEPIFACQKKILRRKIYNIMVGDNNFPGVQTLDLARFFRRGWFPRRKVSAKQYLQIRGAKVES